MKKKTLRSTVLAVLLAFFALGLQGFTVQPDAQLDISVPEKHEEQKVICRASINDAFAEDTLLVTLNRAASRQFLTYTPLDFPETDCIKTKDLTECTVDYVATRYDKKNARFYEEALREAQEVELIQPVNSDKMLVDLDAFRRILCLTIADGSKEKVLSSIKLLEQRSDIFAAGPNYISQLKVSPPNDYYYALGQQEGLNGPYGINAPGAWNYTQGSQNLRVGIIDSGIAAHPDLNANLVTGKNFIDNSANTNDTYHHGTVVAGIVGARGNNAIGVTGVCWNVSLVPLKVANTTTTLNNYIIAAIDWASKNNVPILNFSGGNYYDDPALKTQINKYTGLLVCAASNENNNNDTTPFYPADYSRTNPRVISVGAIRYETGNRTTPADWGVGAGSNYGAQSVDLFAPGHIILSTYPTAIYPDGYLPQLGTSMAAPFVTGTAALLLSYEPSLTAAELKSIIVNSVTKYSAVSGLCRSGGRLNAADALDSVEPSSPILFALMGKSGSEWTVNVNIPLEAKVNGVSTAQYNSKMCFAGDARTWKNLSDLKPTTVVNSVVQVKIKENFLATSIVFGYLDKYGHRHIKLAYYLSLNAPYYTAKEVTIYKPHVNS